jgi:hypothetical protein
VTTRGYAKIPAILKREWQTMDATKAVLKPDHAQAAQQFVELTEYAEQEKGRDFFHTLMKSVEHLQGTIAIRDHATAYVQGTRENGEVYRPFIELARKAVKKDWALSSPTSSKGLPVVDPTVTVDSLFATSNFFYNEADLGHIWHLAGNDPNKQALARQHIIDVYATLLDYMDKKAPVFRRIDQKAADKDLLGQLTQNIGITKEGIKPGTPSESYETLLSQIKSFHQADKTFLIPAQTLLPDGRRADLPLQLPADALLPIETAARIKRLYQAAIALVQQDRFHPLPGEILFTMDNAETQQRIAADPIAATEHKTLREAFCKGAAEGEPASHISIEAPPPSPGAPRSSRGRKNGR